MVRFIAIAAVAGMTTTGCSSAKQDRPESEPDGFGDATQVTVWRNADWVPNIATFCANNLSSSARLCASVAVASTNCCRTSNSSSSISCIRARKTASAAALSSRASTRLHFNCN